MTKLRVEELVRAAVARSAKGLSSRQIAGTTTLRELGYGDAEVQELQWRLLKAASRRSSGASELTRALPITRASTVQDVIDALREILPPRTAAASRAGLSVEPRRREVQAAVIAALSERSPKLDFSQIKQGMKLGRDLGLDPAAIAEAKIGVFYTLSGKDFPTYYSTVKAGRASTVKSMIDQVYGVLPGDVGTGPKGKALAFRLAGDVTTGRKGVSLSLPGDVTTGPKGRQRMAAALSGGDVTERQARAAPERSAGRPMSGRRQGTGSAR